MDFDKEGGSSKHSDTNPGVSVRSESNDCIDAYPKLRVRIASNEDHISHASESSRASEYDSDDTDASSRSEYLAPIMEELMDATDHSDHNFFRPNDDDPSEDGKKNSDNLNEGDRTQSGCHIKGFIFSSSASRSKRLEPIMKEPVDAIISNEHKSLHPENDDDRTEVNKINNDLNKDDKPIPVVVSRSSSISSLASSEDDLFEVNPDEGFNPREYATSSSERHEATQPASKDQEIGFSADDSSKLDRNDSPVQVSTSQAHNTNPLLDHTPSPVQNNTNGYSGPNVSAMQFPPVQVMQHPKGYNPRRIPSSIFERSNSKGAQDWSTCSNESLFSIHVGNNSFSHDGAFMFRSGELTAADFIAANHSHPQGVVEIESQPTTTRMQFESKDETFKGVAHETIQDADRFPEVHHGEARKSPMSSPKSSTHSKHSRESVDSAYSFAFPILTEAAMHNSKQDETGEEQLLPQEVTEQQQQQPQTPAAPATPKSNSCSWFNCFSCCSHCPWCRCCNHRCNCC